MTDTPEYIPPETIEGGGVTEDEFICDVPGCDRTFTTIQGVQMHKMRVHNGRIPGSPAAKALGLAARSTCELCGRVITDSRMQTHLRRVHNAKTPAKRSPGRYECDICGNIYASLDSLGRHNRTVHRAAGVPARVTGGQISDEAWEERAATVRRASAEYVRITAERADYQLDLSQFVVDDDIVILRTPDGQRWMLRKID